MFLGIEIPGNEIPGNVNMTHCRNAMPQSPRKAKSGKTVFEKAPPLDRVVVPCARAAPSQYDREFPDH